MLFPYTYVPHQMEKMQEYIDFIFHEVWCKAPTSGPFGLHLFDANADLHEVMESFYYSDRKNADFFYGNVEKIYRGFSRLNDKQVRRLKWWYVSNNEIEQLCCNHRGYPAVRYSDIEKKYSSIADDLNRFFMGLYDFDAAALKKKVGTVDDHYRSFVSANKSGRCPFCGIGAIKGMEHTKREAYDHYLPKAIYPFNSINFRNLAPACHECNSSYKLSKDPVYGVAGRRKAFYPYATAGHAIELRVTLRHSDIENLATSDIDLQFGPASIAEEIGTWKSVYGIEERYKARLCGDGDDDGKYWLIQVLDEWKEDGRDPADYMKTLTRHAQSNPYANVHFLKKPFLEACSAVGLF